MTEESEYGNCNGSCYYYRQQVYFTYYSYYRYYSYCSHDTYFDCGEYTTTQYQFLYGTNYPNPSYVGSCASPDDCRSALDENSAWIIAGILFLAILVCICCCISANKKSR